jgi:hypothetical protein
LCKIIDGLDNFRVTMSYQGGQMAACKLCNESMNTTGTEHG